MKENKYGHLLDNYMGGTPVNYNYQTNTEREEEARKRYGHLLDYAKPDHKIYEDMIAVDNASRKMRQQRAEAYEQENIRRQERIEREKREEQERIDKHNAFVNSFLEKKEAERQAAEEKRKAAEREQNMLDNIQKMINLRDETEEMVTRTNARLAKEEEKRKAHEEKMKWYDSQKKYMSK